MKKHFRTAAIAAAVASALAAGYGIRSARADGVPGTTPMYYSGNLVEAGTPVTGARDVLVHVWDSATAGTVLCSTTAPATPFQNGSFRVALSDACTPVIHATPDLWIEVVIAGTSLGRTKLGAVPFALEAGRAADLTPSLRAGLVPAGSVIAFMGATPPTGWLACDGSAVGRTAYPDLFAAVGTTFGSGDGSTTFNLPDMRGRTQVGRGTNTDVDALTDNDGLAVGARKPRHRHGRGTLAINDHALDMFGAYAGHGYFSMYTQSSDGWNGGMPQQVFSHSISGEVGDTTGPLDAPAFQVVNYIIKQ